ncbi:MAG TPA: hypothetical protein VFV89_19730 [Nocardioides sp.]|uniref:hypothetical protein n=1 Tax=Nocardioides sp. TaxID=35761 RepID=UPI002E31B6F4|nr:hypothetical protein [Nocardioides sp.]HEX5090049.1 hypothetical protein [Nocardioides sp.]
MDTLRDLLAELADDAPTGAVPPAEPWSRGRRLHRLRVTAIAVILVAVGAVGTEIAVRLANGADESLDPAPAKTVGFALRWSPGAGVLRDR